VYVVQHLLDLEGRLEAERLRAAGEGLLRRHASLRAGIWQEAGSRPVQVVLREAALPFRVAEAGDGTELERLAAEERARRFDLRHPPLLRVLLARLGPERHRLVVTSPPRLLA